MLDNAFGSADWFDAAPDPILLLRADGELARANAAFHAVFKQAVSAQRPPWGRVRPPPFEGEVRKFEAAAPDGRVFEWSERLLPDGRRLAFARDVSARACAAREADRAKTTLFATLTHELRTPLNGILGMAGLLAQTRLDAAQSEYVEAVRRSGEHLLDLITEILDYSRLEAGRVALEDAPFSLEEVAQSVAELLSPKAHAKGLEIVAVAHAEAPAGVRGDEGRVRQILFNLAGNAVKFTQSGGVVIEILPLRGGLTRLSVRDTGPGVAPEKQALIFEEFQQADTDTARRFGGAGLGLAIVKRLAEAMGGTVGLSSRPGFGATFTVDLPLAPAAAPAPAPPRLEGARLALRAREPLTGAVRAMVESLGGRIVPADAAPQATLIDHALAREEIGALSGGVPAIVLLPQEERGALEAYRQAGVAGYLLKPLRRASLGEQARRAIRGLPATELGSEAGPAGGLSPRRLRVLLAEDNPVNALLARTLLSRAQCLVEVVADGEQAAAAAAQRAFDAIFLDLRMPVLDGLGAARRIRGGAGPCAQTPIFALTADASERDRAAALAAGMSGFITKPLDPARLLQALEGLPARATSATISADAAQRGAAMERVP